MSDSKIEDLDRDILEKIVRTYVGDSGEEILHHILANTHRHDIASEVSYSEDSIVFSDGTLEIGLQVSKSGEKRGEAPLPEIESTWTALPSAGICIETIPNGRIVQYVRDQARNYHGWAWGRHVYVNNE